MHPYTSGFWTDFALGQLGASAALLGLVFVGISINISVMVKSPLSSIAAPNRSSCSASC